MSFFATKNGITRIIIANQIEEYKNFGWEITSGNNEDLEVEEKGNNTLSSVIINGEEFIGYSSFKCVNTKTYVTEPTRTYDGSIPNINEYETFVVPRLEMSFDFMTIQDFRRFLKAIAPNEFPVTYYDYELDKIVTYNMYIEPRDMSTIYNKGLEVLGITGQKISLIATLNNINYITINYYDNITNIQANPSYNGDKPNNYILLDKKDMVFGNWYFVRSGNELNHNKPSTDTKTYRFKNWNTKPDGTGQTYLSGYTFQASIMMGIDLYAQWEVI